MLSRQLWTKTFSSCPCTDIHSSVVAEHVYNELLRANKSMQVQQESVQHDHSCVHGYTSMHVLPSLYRHNSWWCIFWGPTGQTPEQRGCSTEHQICGTSDRSIVDYPVICEIMDMLSSISPIGQHNIVAPPNKERWNESRRVRKISLSLSLCPSFTSMTP